MRIHFGFSKFISIKKLIYILGFLFVGLLAFLGATEHAYAETWTTDFNYLNYSSNPTFNYVQFLDHSARPITTDTFKSSIQWGNNFQSNIENYCPNGKCPITILYNKNNGNMYENNFYFKSSSGNINVGEWSQPNGLFDRISIPLNLNFLCAEGNNSVFLRFKFRSISPNWANTNLIKGPFINYGPINDINDYLGATIETVYNTEQVGPNPERQCYFTNMIIDPNDSDFVNYDLTCPGLPVDSNLLFYNIKFYSKYLLNLTYSDLLKENASQNITFYSGGWDAISYTLDYSCSFDQPYDPNTSSLGVSSIDYNNISNDGSSASVIIPGSNLDTSIFDDIEYPSSVLTIITYPIQRLTDFLDYIKSPNHFCAPIRIDFSSFTRAFGGGDYVLSIPCLRSVLIQLLGVQIIGSFTLYTLIDIMIAFVLFCELGLTFYHVILEMLEGNSLSNYLIGRVVRPRA